VRLSIIVTLEIFRSPVPPEVQARREKRSPCPEVLPPTGSQPWQQSFTSGNASTSAARVVTAWGRALC